jgi:hypothetical protein
MIFGEINSAINLVDRFKKYYRFFKNPTESESVANRFIRLFETHGVHRNQIPRFFGHGITLKDLQDDLSLLAKLDEEILDAACKLFAVRREWLDGAERQAHPHHDFYKEPEEFLKFIKALKLANAEGDLDGELFAPDVLDSGAEAILILNEVIGHVGNEPIYRYHLCNNWSYTYWKARAYLTACIALAWKHHVFVRGTIASNKSINKLAQGEILLACQKIGVESLSGKKWYPEDMALIPEVFLQDVDPEYHNFGNVSALDLWLELEKQGLMDTGIKKDVRLLFIQERASYSPN